jgi:hypothetical protein
MSAAKSHSLGQREVALSLLLAGLIWLSVLVERLGELTLQVPIVPEHLPAGLRVDSPLHGRLEVTVSGPRIVLARLWFCAPVYTLDLSRAAAGTAAFQPRESSLHLDRELKLVRIVPASLTLTLTKDALK